MVNKRSRLKFFLSHPLFYAVPILLLYYGYRLAYLPIEESRGLLLTIAIVFTLAGEGFALGILRRFGRVERPTLELILAIIVIVFLALTLYEELPLAIPFLGILMVWMIWMFLERRSGLFFTGYTGIVIFSFIFFSSIAVHRYELMIIQSILSRNESPRESPGIRIHQWIQEEKGELTLLTNGEGIFRLKFPGPLRFTEKKGIESGDENVQSLSPVQNGMDRTEMARIGYESSKDSIQNIIFYDLSDQNIRRPEYENHFVMLLNYLRQIGAIQNIQEMGLERLGGTQGELYEGRVYRYTDSGGKIQYQTGLYFDRSAEHVKNPLPVILLREIYSPTFPHTPDFMDVFNSIERIERDGFHKNQP